MQEPEFIGGEIDLRINIYRGQINTNGAKNGIDGVGNDNNIVGKVPGKCRESAGELPTSEQEQQIYNGLSRK